jgi:ArsR family metal-binding transcriptional regulator
VIAKEQPVADLLVAFQHIDEFERCAAALRGAGAAFDVIAPPPEAADVAVPAIRVADAARGALHQAIEAGTVIAGQVWYREPLPDAWAGLPPPPDGADDPVGRMAVTLVAPCIAEEDHLRLTVHVQGDLGPLLPYLNAEQRGGTYAPAGPTFTFMDGPRLINLSPHRVAVARARDLVDAWATLVRLKRMLVGTWARRGSITPLHERRVRTSALEIYTRLPRTNCRACGEATCLAFAAKLLAGDQRLEHCRPVFDGTYPALREPLEDLVRGLGL